MFWTRLSIRKKLFLAIVVTVMTTTSFFAAAVYWNTREGISQYILAADIARLHKISDILVEMHDPDAGGWPELAGDRAAFDEIIRNNLSIPRNPNPAFLNEEDNSEGQAGNARGSNQLNRRGPRSAGGQRGAGRRDFLYVQARLSLLDPDKSFIVGAEIQPGRVGYRPIIKRGDDGEETILGHLAMTMPEIDVRATDHQYRQNELQLIAMTAILAFSLSILAALILSRVVVSPVNELLKAAKQLSEGNLDARLNVTRYDEIGELQWQFNKLAQTLEKNEIAERQWISDTSHELQTPLAVLRAEIEALQDGVRVADEKTLASMHESIIRISMLVKDISALAHAREAAVAGNMIDEDLSEIVQTRADHAKSLIADSGLKLELEIQPGLIVSCDKLRIGQLIDNLLSNSIRYTNSGGTIKLTLFRKADEAVLQCYDSAPCPPAESIPKLFDRFYRDEKSRSRQSGGSGLGLAICKVIVNAHQGYIYADRSALGGLKVVVALPVVDVAEEIV